MNIPTELRRPKYACLVVGALIRTKMYIEGINTRVNTMITPLLAISDDLSHLNSDVHDFTTYVYINTDQIFVTSVSQDVNRVGLLL